MRKNLNQSENFQPYDLIGDIHGEVLTFRALLAKLGYKEKSGVYSHQEGRKIIFLGDLIDRGSGQIETVDIVRAMVDAGQAHCIMGNHEFNALCFHTKHPIYTDKWLRKRDDKNINQHIAFLNEFLNPPKDRKNILNETLEWFRSLPLWLDLGHIRAIHACWDSEVINRTSPLLSNDQQMTDELLVLASIKDGPEYSDIETILKGKELDLPDGQVFYDKDGNPRDAIRVRWHENKENYRDAFLGPESQRSKIPENLKTQQNYVMDYSHDEPPVFIGHYWFENAVPKKLAPNIACLDYSVAKEGGKLVAYRWDGEQEIDDSKFLWADRVL